MQMLLLPVQLRYLPLTAVLTAAVICLVYAQLSVVFVIGFASARELARAESFAPAA